jgi:hypothetical protein
MVKQCKRTRGHWPAAGRAAFLVLLPLLDDRQPGPSRPRSAGPARSPTSSSPIAVITTEARLAASRGRHQTHDRPRTAHGAGLSRQRYVVERRFAHLHNFRRLRIRYERYPEIHTVCSCSPARSSAGAGSSHVKDALTRDLERASERRDRVSR